MTRPSARRLGEDARRQDFVDAALSCLAEHGYHGATVRRIAAAAGVAPGLLTHYYTGKEELIADAYEALAARLLDQSIAAAGDAGGEPVARLRTFILACFAAPVLDPQILRVWINFWSLSFGDPRIRRIHAETYVRQRDTLSDLIGNAFAAAGRPAAPDEIRRLAVGANAVLDGLWLEWCLDPSALAPEAAARIACQVIGAATGLDLTATD
jgi:TetR/AcrR family transcriptional repressor of bet genes